MTATGKKITDFTNLIGVADNDVFLVVDRSDTTSSTQGTTKKITFSNIKSGVTSSLSISNWDTAYNWGNHSDAGYLTSYVETDPVFVSHPAFGITATKIGQWDTAYGWGNHAVQGYLQSISNQTLNALSDVDTAGVSTNDVLKYNGTAWVPGVVSGVGTTINELNDVGDVDLSVNPTDGQVLKYNASISKWVAGDDLNSAGVSLSDFSVTTEPAGSTSLTYDNTSGTFTYTPPDLSTYLQNIIEDTSPQLGGDLDLNSNSIRGIGDIDISGDVAGEGLKLSQNNSTVGGTVGTSGEIRQIGGAPFFYDGTNWREFYLVNAVPVIQEGDTDWDSVLIRSTFDTDVNDVKFNAVPTKSDPSVGVVTSPRKVGAGSLRLNGENIQYPWRSEYNFTGEWTIEAWFYLDTLPAPGGSSRCLFGQNHGDDTKQSWSLFISVPIAGVLNFSWFNNNNPVYAGTTNPGVIFGSSVDVSSYFQTWFHAALVREATDGKIHLYLDGVERGTGLVDNDIIVPTADGGITIGRSTFTGSAIDGFVDDFRASKKAKYLSASGSFAPPTTQLPITGSTTQVTLPQSNKSGEIILGSSPTWKGTSGVTVTQQSSGNYRLTFTTAYVNPNDYFVMTQPMNQGFASYVNVTRTVGYIDFAVNKQSDDSLVDSGSIAVQIINHS
jgi:hypothetical protein